jgi:hypothetical protein
VRVRAGPLWAPVPTAGALPVRYSGPVGWTLGSPCGGVDQGATSYRRQS